MLILGATAAGGCGSPERPGSVVRIGFFPNVTHAPVVLGIADGALQRAAGDGVQVKGVAFQAGPELMVALAGGSVDIACVGPVPFLTAVSRGVPLQVVAGISTGGVAVVVPKHSAARTLTDLGGHTLAVPQFGNTQDVQIRRIAAEIGIPVNLPGGIRLQQGAPSDCAVLLAAGHVAAAVLPEPWASLYESTGAGRRLDSPELADLKDSPSALLVVRTDFAERHPEVVARIADACESVQRRIRRDPDRARESFGVELGRLTGKSLPDEAARRSFAATRFTAGVDAGKLADLADACRAQGYTRRDVAIARLVGAVGTPEESR